MASIKVGGRPRAAQFGEPPSIDALHESGALGATLREVLLPRIGDSVGFAALLEQAQDPELEVIRGEPTGSASCHRGTAAALAAIGMMGAFRR